MLTRAEKSAIKNLLQSNTWPVLKGIAKDLQDKIAYSTKSRDTEWDTLKATIGDDGQIQGITKFFQELDNAAMTANDDDPRGT